MINSNGIEASVLTKRKIKPLLRSFFQRTAPALCALFLFTGCSAGGNNEPFDQTKLENSALTALGNDAGNPVKSAENFINNIEVKTRLPVPGNQGQQGLKKKVGTDYLGLPLEVWALVFSHLPFEKELEILFLSKDTATSLGKSPFVILGLDLAKVSEAESSLCKMFQKVPIYEEFN